MKKLLPCLLTLLLSGGTCPGQSCAPEGLYLTGQYEIDNFHSKYPGCQAIEGLVKIYGNDISNLDGLLGLRSIGGDFIIEGNNKIKDLSGLDSLVSIGGNLQLSYNEVTVLAGLNHLQTIGGGLLLTATKLYNFQGLDQLSTLNGDLVLAGNSEMINMNGLPHLASLGGALQVSGFGSKFSHLYGLENLLLSKGISIVYTDNLVDLRGLKLAADFQGSLEIRDNNGLTSLMGLENITSVQDDFLIRNNGYLADFNGIPHLNHIGGDLVIENNFSMLQLGGLGRLETVGGDLSILSNYYLTGLDSLSSLLRVGGDVRLGNGYALSSLNGLNAVDTIGGHLEIFNMEQLPNLKGLDQLEHIGGHLNISNNPKLDSLLTFEQLQTVGGQVSLSNNPQLRSVQGLEQLSSVGGSLILTTNPQLSTLLGLNSLTSVGGSCDIRENGLRDLNGLNQLSRIGQDFYLGNNDSLLYLDGLNQLDSIGGYFQLWQNETLQNIAALSQLQSVGGYVHLEGNPQLGSLTGLENLSHIGQWFNIQSNQALTGLCNFSKLDTIPGSLHIEKNPALLNLTGLENLRYVIGHLEILDNDALLDLNGLQHLSRISVNLNIQKNAALTSLSGLASLDQVSGYDLIVAENAALTNLSGLEKLDTLWSVIISLNATLKDLKGLDNLALAYGWLRIEANPILENLHHLSNLRETHGFYLYQDSLLTNLNGLENLSNIQGYASITQCPVLSSLSGLDHLVSVQGLQVEGNPALKNMAGLEQLKTASEWVFIRNNNSLSSLAGLDSLTTVSGPIEITGNKALTDCAIFPICDRLINAPWAAPTIGNNAPGCNTSAEVSAACQTVRIETRVWIDSNGNCEPDAGDTPVADQQVLLASAKQTTLRPTGNNGQVGFTYLKNGPLQLSLPHFPDAHWGLCEEPIALNPDTATLDTIRKTLLLVPLSACPELRVELGLPAVFRSCLVDSYVQVSVQNTGGAPATAVQTAIVVPPVFEVLAAEPLPAGQSGDTLFFGPLDLNPFEKTSVKLRVKTKCDTFLLGQTQCWEAFALLGNACPDSGPPASEIRLAAQCLADTAIRFTLRNIGDATTQAPHQYVLYRNTTPVDTVAFSLAAQQSLVFEVPADGSTQRLEATRRDDGTLTATALEHCGGLTPGMVNAFWLDDSQPNARFACREVVGAFDPNQKTAVPTGIGPAHLLAANRPLQYTIDFQNTGTDTAFQVLLRDVLPAQVDPGSFLPGVASHPYAWEIRGLDTLEVLFSPIALPDSNVNEPASHGFFSFAIAQKPDLPDGSILENTASIIFDFNPPIVTNTVRHTIGELSVSVDAPQRHPDLWQVLGNPTRESAIFQAKTWIGGAKQFELYNSAGRRVRQARFEGQAFEFRREALAGGLYFYKILDVQGRVFSGKMVVLE
ncbi:MAG: hypothetical protein IT260_14525 [Saprospiraceae bacterium]|nr:hypothetical protein [Saprospiraceae bacterium]